VEWARGLFPSKCRRNGAAFLCFTPYREEGNAMKVTRETGTQLVVDAESWPRRTQSNDGGHEN